jgi:ankyrin repeat protein
LIEGGSDVNFNDLYGLSPLHFGIFGIFSNLRVLFFLLFLAIIYQRNAEIITALIRAGANIDSQDYTGQTALIYGKI